ncbi:MULTISPECIES: sulfurtransferase [Psychrilyobacter]|uniref:Thiosulfate sulfurtransferase n=1 Tax=Psychrilyobacter piezotolerans TaxID=2293438 RepID=A0ABX9KDB6_9FUSO|nr:MULTISPECIES: rhodanese-like domain-containing protein [Psychrilyobacter]MCS5422931.1 rhodanese-like domain-containing protein [Psychrilyobacter sp. S5]NDI79138.1 sulfurtransferase [Psychrilyobacter piezotolerans]RDE58938.1 thiosulfate sulfurtransferase [Psychrilyobacter sp. S5]REI39494.1 thiosulfate sulfurtransferase [Psychrilyobacter piezotolerans]
MKKMLIITLSIIMVVFSLVGCSTEDKKEKEKSSSQGEYTIIDTQRVEEALNDPSFVIVDTRLNDAFNGWKLEGISRGGRIRGAVDFSANWLKVEADHKEDILNEALETKGIIKEKNIVLYDANGKDAQEVADYLKEKGFKKIYVYDMNKWADDAGLPMENYRNYQLIVPASIVKDIIDGNKAETFENANNIKIVEASWGEEKTSYAKGHIPTSFHINTDAVEPPPAWMLADDEILAKFAVKYGFTKEDTVIVTGEEQMAAYRVATVLRYIGVEDVRVLNGGTTAWTMAGYELETESNKPVAVEDFGGVIPGNPDVIDTMEETKAGLKTPDQFTLVDNRTWKEFIGEESGYTYHDKKGRIPGAVFGYAGKTNSYSMDYFRNIDKTMRNAGEFLDIWKKQGIDTNKHLSFMCGSGWRVAEIYTYANVVGIEDIGIFSDGWIGWSNEPNNPTEKGEPKK